MDTQQNVRGGYLLPKACRETAKQRSTKSSKQNKTKQKNKHTSEVPLHFRISELASRRTGVKASFSKEQCSKTRPAERPRKEEKRCQTAACIWEVSLYHCAPFKTAVEY